ncbi:MAG: hypothetical protein M9942_13645, partial [Microthrixaceae bacterium]|nr:hypothetical protein [Microthrixaceae bacterium]
ATAPALRPANGPGRCPAVCASRSTPPHAVATARATQATGGDHQRIDESWALAAAMVAGGSSAEVIDAGDHAHGALDTAIGEPTDEVVTPPVGHFLGSCLR